MSDTAAALASVVEEERRDGPLVRRVTIRREFDCHDQCAFGSSDCRPGSGGWHGVGGRQLLWSVAVIGQGAVGLDLHTPIYTEAALARGGARLAGLLAKWEPLGALDLHHARPPDYLATYPSSKCDLIEGRCWTDVTFLQAEAGYAAFEHGGTPAVWSWLAEVWLPQVVGAKEQIGG